MGSGAHLAHGYHGSFPGLKKLGCVDYWPSLSTEVKNDWSYTSASPICCHGMDNDNYLLLPVCVCIGFKFLYF